jgi:hypothetical protein
MSLACYSEDLNWASTIIYFLDTGTAEPGYVFTKDELFFQFGRFLMRRFIIADFRL